MKQNLCPIKNKKEFELTKSLPTKKEKNLSPNRITDDFYQSRNTGQVLSVSRGNTSHTFENIIIQILKPDKDITTKENYKIILLMKKNPQILAEH